MNPSAHLNDAGTLKLSTPSEREIALTRIFNATRRLVFEAITKPELLKRWLYGPEGWSLDVCEVDLRAGGAYRYVWRKPGVPELGVSGVFREVTPPERLVATEQFDNPWYPGEALITQQLAERNGRTTLTMILRYESQAARDGVLQTPMDQGLGASYDRLAKVLAELEAVASGQ
jgi:uncharacterized protein YndB with AHSA1/START domain